MLWFAAAGDVGEVAGLLEGGSGAPVDVDAMDYDRRTALALAASEGHSPLVRFLLARGANPNAEDRWGHRPLDDARGDEVRKLLRDAGARHGYQATEEEEVEVEEGGVEEDWKEKEKEEKGEDGGEKGAPGRGGRDHLRGDRDSEVYKGYPAEDSRADGLDDGKPAAALEVDRDELVFTGEVLGEGSYGWVREAEWRGTEVAVKCLVCSACGVVQREDHQHQFMSEVSIMSRLAHPSIVQFLGVCSRDGSPSLLVTERLAGGNLESLLRRMIHGQERVTLRDKVRMLVQLAQGLAYLHGRRPWAIIHRDLKPSNLLLDAHRNLKIGDFGLSVAVPHAGPEPIVDAPFRMTGRTGSFLYMAPEVFRGEEYSAKVDVYSFACIAYYLLEGTPPLPVVRSAGARGPRVPAEELPAPLLEPVAAAAVAADGARPVFRPGAGATPPMLRDLIRACWADDPGARPPFVHVCERLRSITRQLQRERKGRGHSGPSPLGAWAAAFRACTGRRRSRD